MNYNIDFDLLRNDLLNYFYSLAFTVNMAAVLESDRVKKANNEELIIIAQENNFNLENYLIKKLTKIMNV